MPKFPSRIKDAYPHDETSEQTVLCALLNDPEGTWELVQSFGLESDWFYDADRKTVFEGLSSMQDKKAPISLESATSWFRERDLLANPADTLTHLATFVTTILHVEFHFENLKKKAAQRFGMIEAEHAYHEIHKALEIQEVYDVTTKAFEKTHRTCEDSRKEETHDEYLLKYIDEVSERVKNKERKTGIPVPFPTIAKRSFDLMPGNTTVIIGQKGSGKSSLGQQILCEAAVTLSKKCADFSLEMSKEERTDRAISYIGKIHGTHLLNGTMSQGEMNRFMPAIQSLRNAPIRFYDHFVTWNGIEEKMRGLKRSMGLDLALVDYLQLLKTPHKSDKRRDEELSAITAGAKRLAMELHMHIIIIAAANKDMGLRESSGCEFDAHTIFKILNDAETQKPKTLWVDKWRNAEDRYSIPIQLHGEYCRMVEVDKTHNE